MHYRCAKLVLILGIGICGPFLHAVVEAWYLTYPASPASSIAIHWIDSSCEVQELSYCAEPGEWISVSSVVHPLQSYALHTVALYDLAEETAYRFVLQGKEHAFHTLSSKKTFHMVIGGDVYRNKTIFAKTCAQVCAMRPDFVVFGGDLAYAKEDLETWISFFRALEEHLALPFVAVVGNHDINKRSASHLFPLFFPYFSPYGVVDVTDFCSLFLLDSGHLASIRGEQSTFLAKALHARALTAHKIPIYHVAAYPSVYAYDKKAPTLIRTFWVPFFEKYGVSLVFEHHNHAWKRTKPLLQEHIHSKGIVFLGDGSFGARPRAPNKNLWYIENSKKSPCFSWVEVSPNSLSVKTIDHKGFLLDSWNDK